MSTQLTKQKFLSRVEYQKLQDTLKHFNLTDPRNTTLIELSMHTGARPSEILGILAQDLNSESNSVFIKGLKGSRDREIPIPKELFQRVHDFARFLEPDQRIFKLALRTYQHVWHQYRPCKKGVRSLRHTFAIRLYEKTKDVRLVQMALGHKYLNTTQIYVDYIYNQEELKKLLL